EITVQAALAGATQGLKHIGGATRVQLAGLCGDCERSVPDIQAACRSRGAGPCGGFDSDDGNRYAKLGGALFQQLAAGYGYQNMRLSLAGQQQAQIRTDPGRLTGGQGKATGCGHDRPQWQAISEKRDIKTRHRRVSLVNVGILNEPSFPEGRIQKAASTWAPAFTGATVSGFFRASLQLDLYIRLVANLAQPGLQFFVV